MWNYLVKNIYEGSQKDIDFEESFYCGDAAGRKTPPFKDFSNDDLLYSVSLGLKFYTPEMLFKNSELNFKLAPGTKIDQKYKKEQKAEEEKKSSAPSADTSKLEKICKKDGQEMLMFIGSPGSGKSVLYRTYLSSHYKRINNDTIKNPKKAEKLCLSLLEQGKSVVVDNMNAQPKQRNVYISLA